MAALSHFPNGSYVLGNVPADDPLTSVCGNYQSGDTFASPTNPTDATCRVCVNILLSPVVGADPGVVSPVNPGVDENGGG